MLQVVIRFYEELNTFLPAPDRKKPIPLHCRPGTTVKALIEDRGVPHTEVDLVLVNGEPVDFDYRVQEGDRISVYPVFEAFDIGSVSRVRPLPLRITKFVLDVQLGKLARRLRMAGFDTLYAHTFTAKTLIRLSLDEKRIILTRNRAVLKHKQVTHGYYIKSDVPAEQFREVVKRFDLYQNFKPLSRCLVCNTLLEPVDKEALKDRVPERVLAVHTDYRQCPTCHRVYWRGSHWEDMLKRLEQAQQPPEA